MDISKYKDNKILYYPLAGLSKLRRLAIKATRLVSLKPINNKKTIRVGFIVQLPSVWDKQVDVYLEMLERQEIEVFLFGVPQFDWGNNSTEGKNIDEYFITNYPEIIDICKNADVKNAIRKYNLDYLFYPRPYDHYLPKGLRSSDLYRYVKCCYIPYGMSGSDIFDSGNIYNGFFDNISVMYMDSKPQCDLMMKQYPLSRKLNKRRIKYLGYPVLYKYLSWRESPEDICITWTPRWSTDARTGGSNFVKYADSFLKLVKNSSYNFIFRPHPLMFDELVVKGIISEDYKENYIKELAANNVLFDISSPIDEIFKRTTLLITDFSTIIPQFFLTGRSIIYCDSGIKLNQIYKDLIGHSYHANEWDEVLRFIDDLTQNKDDYKARRQIYIDDNFKNKGNPSQRIVDDLLNGGAK